MAKRARSGAPHWRHQRVTAALLVPLVLFLIGLLPVMAGATHGEFTALLGHPVVAIAMALLLGAGLWHMKLGLEVVIDDYAGDGGMRAFALATVTLVSLALALAGLGAIVSLAT